MSLREQVLSEDRRPTGWAGERVLKRVQFLPEEDRVLMQMILSGRASQRELAATRGQPPGTVCRRVRRLMTLLYHPIVVALTERGDGLRPEVRQLGIEHFLHRRPSKELAEYHQITPRRARQIIDWVRGWADGVGR